MRLLRFVRLSLFTLLGFSLCAGAQSTASFEKRAANLAGVWFATETGNRSQPRVLRITNLKFADAKGAQYVGYYGYARGNWPEAKDLVARPAGEQIELEYSSSAGSRILLSTTAGDQLVGTLQPKNGAPFSLRFTRSSLPAVYAWVAEHPAPAARASASSTIELVYLSAADCPSCRGWEIDYLERGKLKASAEWANLTFTQSKRGSYQAKLVSDSLPAHLQPVFGQLEKTKRSLFYGTPTFVVLVNGVVRCSGFGPANFEMLVYPTIRAAVREKLAAAKG